MYDALQRLHYLKVKVLLRVEAWSARLVLLRSRASWLAIWRVTVPLLWLLAGLLAFDIYIFAGRLIPTQFTRVPVVPLYEPVAVILSVLLLTPPRRWWLYLVSTYVFQVALYTWFGYPLGFNLVAEAPTAIEPLIAAYLLYRLIPLPPRFAGLREVTMYSCCVVIASMISAFMGASLRASLGFPYWPAWRSWFLADGLANLLLAPGIILWATVGARGLHVSSRRQGIEILLWCLSFLLVGFIAFGTIQGTDVAPALIYVPVPLLLWAAVRFGPRGLATAIALVTLFAISGVENGLGPFAGRSTPANILTLQLFLFVIGVPLFFLAALVQERARTEAVLHDEITERKRAEEALGASEERYRAVVSNLPNGVATLFDEHLRYQLADGPGLTLPKEQLEGKTIWEVFPPETIAIIEEPMRAAIAGTPTTREVNADDRWFLASYLPIRQRMGSLGLTFAYDITDRKQAEEELECLTTRLLHVQDEERRRLARELHDGTAQNLVAINLNLENLQRIVRTSGENHAEKLARLVADSQMLSEQTLREIRTLSYLLHPPLLDETGLVAALEWYVEGFRARSGIPVDLVARPDLGRLPAEAETALFRIVQEGLTNLHRHSGSPSARIRLARRGDAIHLQIQDRGSGMARPWAAEAIVGGDGHRASPAREGPDAHHEVELLGVGIPGMRQRMRQLGGRLDIRSGSRGTTVTAIVPLAG